MTPDQLNALQFINNHPDCLSGEIGRHVGGINASPRSVASKGAALTLELTHLHYIFANFDQGKRFYTYRIRPEGKAALEGFGNA